MEKDAHESGNSNELGLKTLGKEMKKLLLKQNVGQNRAKSRLTVRD